MERRVIVEKLEHLIQSMLTEKQRVTIRATLDGMPVEVIAEKMGSDRNSGYKLVHDARVKLRSGMEEAGISAADLSSTF